MCFEKMGESTRQIQSSGKQAEAGLPSFEATTSFEPTTCMCFEKMGESTRQLQSSGKQAEAGLPSFEANHRRAFLLELIRYFRAKNQCSFASQTFQIITAAIAIKGCSPALLNLYVYDCKVNV